MVVIGFSVVIVVRWNLELICTSYSMKESLLHKETWIFQEETIKN